MRFDDMSHALEGAKSGSSDLDKTLWSLCEGHGNPVPHYADEWFWEARSRGNHTASLSTSTDAVLALLEEKMPEARLDLTILDGKIITRITAAECGEEIVEKDEVSLSPSQMALALIRVTTRALHQQDRILQKSWDASPG